jgi:hypothetical protein
MGYALYRQWAERELVPFPLADMAASLLRHDGGRCFPDIFHNRRFWLGFSLMLAIFLVNGYHAHQEKMIEIPTKFQFYELANQFPFLANSREGYSLLRGTMYFAVIAVAVLLPSEISFTAWFTWPIMVGCTYVYYLQTGQRFSGNDNSMLQVGAFWAMAVVILYAGRVHYLGLCRRALGFRSEGVDGQSVWACRVFLVSAVGLVLILKAYGIPLELAALWTLALIVMFLVVCRLVAEMGIPWTPLDTVGPLTFLLNTVGERTLGARAYALLAIFNSVTTPLKGTLLLLTPAAANAAHVESRLTGRLASLKVIAPFVLAFLAGAAALSIWLGYSTEGAANDYPVRHTSEVMQAANSIHAMFLQGEHPPGIEALLSENRPFAERWSSVRLTPRFPAFFACGAVLVLLTGAARLRFPRFPLHPLPLVLVGTWLMSRYWFSFFLGWVIKKAILKIGGGRLFERTRPFFVGVLVGLVTVFTFWVIVDVAAFWSNNFTFDAKWSSVFRDMFSN